MSLPPNKKVRYGNKIKRPATSGNKFRPCLDSFAIPNPCTLDPAPGLFLMSVPCSHSSSPAPSEACSCEEFCTAETCRNSTNCCETQPEFCPQGFKEESEDECPICLNQNARRASDVCSQNGRVHPISEPSPCSNCSEDQNVGSDNTSDEMTFCLSVPPIPVPVCPNAQTPCCEHKPEPDLPPCVATASGCEKADSHHNEESGASFLQPAVPSRCTIKPICQSEKMSADACAMCHSSKETTCPCHFPPAFSQFGCTGNINGNCGCGQ